MMVISRGRGIVFLAIIGLVLDVGGLLPFSVQSRTFAVDVSVPSEAVIRVPFEISFVFTTYFNTPAQYNMVHLFKSRAAPDPAYIDYWGPGTGGFPPFEADTVTLFIGTTDINGAAIWEDSGDQLGEWWYYGKMGLSTGNALILISSPDVTENAYPQAMITAPEMGQKGSPIAFSSSGSFDPDGTIVSYSWDFGDGTSSTATNPTKTYTLLAFHTVTLTVTDNSGASSSTAHTIFIDGEIVDPVEANPTGTFSINGVEATDTSTHTLSSPTIDLEFVATNDAIHINRVVVEVFAEDGTTSLWRERLTKTSASIWRSTYTLPADGTYELRGTIEWLDHSRVLMALITYVPGEQDSAPGISVFSIAMIVAAVIGLYDDTRQKKR